MAGKRGRRPAGDETSTAISLRLQAELDNMLRAQSIMEGRSVSEIVRESIGMYFGWTGEPQEIALGKVPTP